MSFDFDEDLSRRQLIELVAPVMAAVSSAPFFAAWLAPPQSSHSHTAAPRELPILQTYTPKFFKQDEFDALESFCSILIPTDDTPGAREARCAHFIDFVLSASDGMPEVAQWREAMETLRQTGFIQADAAGRSRIVQQMSLPERDATARTADRLKPYSVYRLIKQNAAFAFYTSRQGMIEALDYKGNSYNASFPACNHPEHQRVA